MSRWSKLFGSPTDAATTIEDKGLIYDLLDQCDACGKYTEECLDANATCKMDSYEAVLEWLMEDGA